MCIDLDCCELQKYWQYQVIITHVSTGDELHKYWWVTQVLMTIYTSTDNKLHKYWRVTQVLSYTSTDDELQNADDELGKYWWWVIQALTMS